LVADTIFYIDQDILYVNTNDIRKAGVYNLLLKGEIKDSSTSTIYKSDTQQITVNIGDTCSQVTLTATGSISDL
jgi:hypothetical protein